MGNEEEEKMESHVLKQKEWGGDDVKIKRYGGVLPNHPLLICNSVIDMSLTQVKKI